MAKLSCRLIIKTSVSVLAFFPQTYITMPFCALDLQHATKLCESQPTDVSHYAFAATLGGRMFQYRSEVH